MSRVRKALLGMGVATALWAAPAAAQTKPAPIVEFVVGSSGFVDEVFDYFTTTGGGARLFVSRRVAIGAEAAWLDGADDSSAWTLTGNVTIDLLPDDRRVVPYIAAGGGLIRQTALVGGGPGSTTLQPFSLERPDRLRRRRRPHRARPPRVRRAGVPLRLRADDPVRGDGRIPARPVA